MDGPLLTLREKIGELLARLPDTDPLALHALGDSLGRADDAAMTTFNDAVRTWLGDQIERGGEPGRLVRIADAWEKFNRAAADVEIYNTERKAAGFRCIRIACRGGSPLIPRVRLSGAWLCRRIAAIAPPIRRLISKFLSGFRRYRRTKTVKSR